MKRQITALHAEKLYTSVKNSGGRKAELIFDETLDDMQMRTLINEGVTIVPGLVAGFMGNDGAGYRYIIGKNETVEEPDLRNFAKELNTALKGRGGGSIKMIQGSVSATRKEIEVFFEDKM